MPETVALSFSIHELITLGFYFIMALYVVYTLVFYYHWQEYSVDAKVSRVTWVLYLVTTAPLMVALGGLTFFIY